MTYILLLRPEILVFLSQHLLSQLLYHSINEKWLTVSLDYSKTHLYFLYFWNLMPKSAKQIQKLIKMFNIVRDILFDLVQNTGTHQKEHSLSNKHEILSVFYNNWKGLTIIRMFEKIFSQCLTHKTKWFILFPNFLYLIQVGWIHPFVEMKLLWEHFLSKCTGIASRPNHLLYVGK